MKNTVSKWIENFKEWLNPQDENRGQYVDDELYRGRRTVKRRNRSIMIRRYSILAGGLVVFLLLIGGIFWGFNRVSSSHQADRLDQEINQLYTDNRHADLENSVTQAKLDNIKSDIGDLKNRKKADSLSSKQALAQNAFDVQSNYNHLFNKQTRVGLKVTTKKVDQQLKTLKHKNVPSMFKTTYTKRLKSVRGIVVKANKLGKRYKAIMDARKNNLSVSIATVEALIKDMSKNQKSQKTVDQQTKLISLKTVINKEDKQAAKDAQAAAAAAEQAAAQAAAEKAAEESSKAESESASKAAAESSSAEAAAEASAAAESSAEAASAAAESSQAAANATSSDSTATGSTSNYTAYNYAADTGAQSDTTTGNSY